MWPIEPSAQRLKPRSYRTISSELKVDRVHCPVQFGSVEMSDVNAP